jgi:hypothetical protein
MKTLRMFDVNENSTVGSVPAIVQMKYSTDANDGRAPRRVSSGFVGFEFWPRPGLAR